jgi:hypothetical protein
MSKFVWNHETGDAGASVLNRLWNRWAKKDHILSLLSLTRRDVDIVMYKALLPLHQSISPTINTIMLHSVQKVDLPALECLVNATIPGSQPCDAVDICESVGGTR